MRFRNLLWNIIWYWLIVIIVIGIIWAIFSWIGKLFEWIWAFFTLIWQAIFGTEEERKEKEKIKQKQAIEDEKDYRKRVDQLMKEEANKTEAQRKKDDMIWLAYILLWLFIIFLMVYSITTA